MASFFSKQTIVHCCVGILLGAGSIAHAAMHIQSYAPSQHDRFYSGVSPARAFVGEAFAWSGVGNTGAGISAGTGTWATLISDNFALSAAHQSPTAGQTVTFYPGNTLTGAKTATVAQVYGTTTGGLPGDLRLIRFFSAVDASITRYPVLLKPTVDDYVDQPIYVYGNAHRVGRNVIDGVANLVDNLVTPTQRTTVSIFDYHTTQGVGADETYLQAGDSGAPSFATVNGALALVGIHSAISSNTISDGVMSFDSFVPAYINQLNAHMSPFVQSVTTVVPEPGLLTLIPVVFGLLMRRRKR